MRISQRPIIPIEKNPFDKYLDTVALLFSLSLIAIPFYYYSILPDSIPIHFNARGEANRYGSKMIIWLLPIIGLSIHFLFKWLNKRPHVFNYPVQISEENAKVQYTLATRVLRFIDVLTLLLFTSIVYQICTTSVNGIGKMMPLYPLLFVLIIFITVGFYFYLSKKRK